MALLTKLKASTVKKIYEDIFQNIYRRNIDIFLCGGASSKNYTSTRDKIKPLLSGQKSITILYPEDLFMEMLNKKKYDLLSLEKFLADNSDIICIVCESPGSFVELGAFVNHSDTFEKVIALVQTKYKNAKSFIMMGPIRHIQSNKRNNVIFYSSDLTEAISSLKKLINKELLQHWLIPKIKDINLISGQYYFIILLLYFYKYIEIKNLIDEIQKVYMSRHFDEDKFQFVYSSAIRRLYKEGLIEKTIIDTESSVYHLSDKGFNMAKTLISDTKISSRTGAFDSIRLSVIHSQYY